MVTGPLARHRMPSDPVLVHRLVRLLHASFRPSVAGTPLRFAMISPPSGCQGDLHPELSNMLETPKNDRRKRRSHKSAQLLNSTLSVLKIRTENQNATSA